MKNLNIAITSLELAIDEIKRTDNQKRIAEANNILVAVWDAKEQLNEGVPFIEVDEILNDVGKRVNDLIANPNSAGRHDLND